MSSFTVLAVVHGGRLAMEAVLFMASINANDPYRNYRVVLAEPQASDIWSKGKGLEPDTRALLEDLGAEIRPFTPIHFGEAYPHGNKIEALSVLGEGEAFVFFDTDTLILSPLENVPFDFDRPSASMRRSDTWPNPDAGKYSRAQIWGSLYAKFGLDFGTSQDTAFAADHWERYLYFNAGFWFHGDAKAFQAKYLDYALAVRNDPPAELEGQMLNPWLDQVALPLVVHALGGGRATVPPGLIDGSVSNHWRMLPLLYATADDNTVNLVETISAPNKVKRALKQYPAAHRMIYRGEGAIVRKKFGTFAGDDADLRRALKADGHWIR